MHLNITTKHAVQTSTCPVYSKKKRSYMFLYGYIFLTRLSQIYFPELLAALALGLGLVLGLGLLPLETGGR